MKVVIEFDDENLYELLCACRYLVRKIINTDKIIFLCNNKYFSIYNMKHILYIESHTKTMKIVTPSGDAVYDHRTFGCDVPSEYDGFIRINRSTYVNISAIDHIDRTGVYLKDRKTHKTVSLKGWSRLEKYMDI